MAVPWWFPFQSSPLDTATNNGPVPNVEHPPITTRKGRVVYNRKPHRFTRNDIARIAGEVFQAPGEKNKAVWWIRILEEITIWMMQEIISRITLDKVDQDAVQSFYYTLRDGLAKIIDHMIEENRKAALEYLASEYAQYSL